MEPQYPLQKCCLDGVEFVQVSLIQISPDELNPVTRGRGQFQVEELQCCVEREFLGRGDRCEGDCCLPYSFIDVRRERSPCRGQGDPEIGEFVHAFDPPLIQGQGVVSCQFSSVSKFHRFRLPLVDIESEIPCMLAEGEDCSLQLVFALAVHHYVIYEHQYLHCGVFRRDTLWQSTRQDGEQDWARVFALGESICLFKATPYGHSVIYVDEVPLEGGADEVQEFGGDAVLGQQAQSQRSRSRIERGAEVDEHCMKVAWPTRQRTSDVTHEDLAC